MLLDFEKSYLTRKANPINKKQRLITFTEKGKAFASSILEQLYNMGENAMEKLDFEQREQLIACNKKYYELLKVEIENV